jgi:hypothetical protein
VATQERDFMPQYQDLHILGSVASGRSTSQPNNRAVTG